MYLYRAVDKAGKTVDFYLSPKRDVTAAQAFLRKAMKGQRIPSRSRWLHMRGRVEDWRPLFLRFGLSVAPRFRWECLTIRTVNGFPAPATSHVASGFPALRAPAQFALRFM